MHLAGQLLKYYNLLKCHLQYVIIWKLTSMQYFNLLSDKTIRKCTSADYDRGKKRHKTMQLRLIEVGWFIHFAWLIHDSGRHVFRCKVCVHVKAKNMFVTRKDYAKPKKDDLTKHEISANHRRSSLSLKCQIDFVTANDHVNLAITAQMLTMLMKAKNCLPTVKNTFI